MEADVLKSADMTGLVLVAAGNACLWLVCGGIPASRAITRLRFSARFRCLRECVPTVDRWHCTFGASFLPRLLALVFGRGHCIGENLTFFYFYKLLELYAIPCALENLPYGIGVGDIALPVIE